MTQANELEKKLIEAWNRLKSESQEIHKTLQLTVRQADLVKRDNELYIDNGLGERMGPYDSVDILESRSGLLLYTAKDLQGWMAAFEGENFEIKKTGKFDYIQREKVLEGPMGKSSHPMDEDYFVAGRNGKKHLIFYDGENNVWEQHGPFADIERHIVHRTFILKSIYSGYEIINFDLDNNKIIASEIYDVVKGRDLNWKYAISLKDMSGRYFVLDATQWHKMEMQGPFQTPVSNLQLSKSNSGNLSTRYEFIMYGRMFKYQEGSIEDIATGKSVYAGTESDFEEDVESLRKRIEKD